MAGCSVFGSETDSNSPPLQIRAPRPTFTPTPVQPADASVATTQAPPPIDRTDTPVTEVGASAENSAKAVVNTPLVNARSGPGIDNPVVATAERGTELSIIGRNAERTWWNVCCLADTTAWIIDDFVDTDGSVDSVPVTDGVGQSVLQRSEEPPVTSDSGPNSPITPSRFDLVGQEQFPESSVVRLFAYVYAGNDALAGYTLGVTKDGVELPVSAQSFGGQPAYTWPFQDARQRHQNLKIEFPDIPPAGVWEIQLVDESGNTIGPSATFTLSANDPLQELYVRYEQQ